MNKYLLLLIISILLCVNIFSASNRETLTISGILKTADGNYLNGNYSIDFNIFPTAGGASVYDENHNNSQAAKVVVTNGYFSVNLGDTNVLPSNLFTADYNLAMNVGSAGWLSPTIRLNAAPNAVTASRAFDFNVAQDLNVTRNTQIKGTLTVTGATKVLGTSALTLDGGRLNAVDLNVSGVATFATALADGNLANITTAGKVAASAISDLNVQYARLNANNTFANNVNVTGVLSLTTALNDTNLAAITTAGKVKASAISDLNVQYARLNAVNTFANPVNFSEALADGNLANITTSGKVKASAISDLNVQYARLNANNTFANNVDVTGVLSLTTALNDTNLAAITTAGKVKLSALDTDLNLAYARLNANNVFTNDLNISGTKNVTLDGGKVNTVDLNVSGTLNVQSLVLSSGNSTFTVTGQTNTTDLNVQNNLVVKGVLGGNTNNVILVNDTNALTLEGGRLNAVDLNISNKIFAVNSALSAVTLSDDFNAAGIISGWDLNASKDVIAANTLIFGVGQGIFNVQMLGVPQVTLNRDINVSGNVSATDLNASRNILIGTASAAAPKTLTWNAALSAVTLDDDLNVKGTISGKDLNAFGNILIGTGAAVGPVTLTYNQLVSNSGAVTLDDDFNAKGTISGWDLNASDDLNALGNLYVTGSASKILFGNATNATMVNAGDINTSGTLYLYGGFGRIVMGNPTTPAGPSDLVTTGSIVTSLDVNILNDVTQGPADDNRQLWIDGNIQIKMKTGSWLTCNVVGAAVNVGLVAPNITCTGI